MIDVDLALALPGLESGPCPGGPRKEAVAEQILRGLRGLAGRRGVGCDDDIGLLAVGGASLLCERCDRISAGGAEARRAQPNEEAAFVGVRADQNGCVIE